MKVCFATVLALFAADILLRQGAATHYLAADIAMFCQSIGSWVYN